MKRYKGCISKIRTGLFHAEVANNRTCIAKCLSVSVHVSFTGDVRTTSGVVLKDEHAVNKSVYL
jgi:hypothetical protein